MKMKQPVINIMTYVLDDQALVLQLIERAFNNAGIKNYQLFNTEAEFLDAATDDVHIAVIDYLLGNSPMNGLEVCKALLEKCPECYVIIMSGQTDMDVVIEFMNSGAKRYVKKYEGNYILKVVEYMQIAAKIIERRLNYYTTLLLKYNELEAEDDVPTGN